jgi:hypothetical protein
VEIVAQEGTYLLLQYKQLKRIPEQAQERDEKGVKTATKALAP